MTAPSSSAVASGVDDIDQAHAAVSPMTSALKLHRSVRADAWKLADSDLHVVAVRRGQWHLRVLGGGHRTAGLAEWLIRNGLTSATFDTRRDAVNAVAAADASDPLPRHEGVKLIRAGAGAYRTEDGRWTVTRCARGWDVQLALRTFGQQLGLGFYCRTLHRARRVISDNDKMAARAIRLRAAGLPVTPLTGSAWTSGSSRTSARAVS